MGNPRWRPQNFKCMYLRFQTRYQWNSNGHAYVFGVLLSIGTYENIMRPNRKRNKFKMAAGKLCLRVSLPPDKISAKFHRLYLIVRGPAFHWDSWELRIPWDHTGSRKIQDDDLSTSHACLCALRQDINGIPTPKPTFSRSSIPLELVGMMCDQTGSGKHKVFCKCENIWLVYR